MVSDRITQKSLTINRTRSTTLDEIADRIDASATKLKHRELKVKHCESNLHKKSQSMSKQTAYS